MLTVFVAVLFDAFQIWFGTNSRHFVDRMLLVFGSVVLFCFSVWGSWEVYFLVHLMETSKGEKTKKIIGQQKFWQIVETPKTKTPKIFGPLKFDQQRDATKRERETDIERD